MASIGYGPDNGRKANIPVLMHFSDTASGFLSISNPQGQGRRQGKNQRKER